MLITKCQHCGQDTLIEQAIREHQFVNGNVHIQAVHWPTRQIVQDMRIKNKIPTIGLRFLSTVLKGATPAPTAVAVGVDATAADDADTTLASEAFRDSITGRIDITNGVRIRFFLPTTAANGSTLREAGIFGPGPTFLMLARVTYADIVKTTSIAVNYSWDITFAQP